MFRRFWRTEKCKHSLTLQSQWPESSSGLVCLLRKPAALGLLREGLGRVAAAGRVSPSLLPACFARLPAQKGCVEHACFGVNWGEIPFVSLSAVSPGKGVRGGSASPRLPVSGVTRLSLCPPLPLQPVCVPRGPGGRDLCRPRPSGLCSLPQGWGSVS